MNVKDQLICARIFRIQSQSKMPGDDGSSALSVNCVLFPIRLTVTEPSVTALKFSPNCVKWAANFEVSPTIKGLNSTNSSDLSV